MWRRTGRRIRLSKRSAGELNVRELLREFAIGRIIVAKWWSNKPDSKDRHPTSAALARTKTDLILIVEEGYALIQCQVSSAIAAAMLAPLKGKAAGQFRALAGNLVEVDAAVTLPMVTRMLDAKAEMELACSYIDRCATKPARGIDLRAVLPRCFRLTCRPSTVLAKCLN